MINNNNQYYPCDPQYFLQQINKLFLTEDQLMPGYAPFCKHLFIPNFTDQFCYYQEITQYNKELINTRYESRNERELPVLIRYFPKEQVQIHRAKYLDIILYSKQQIDFEKQQQGIQDDNNQDYDWGIISFKAQDIDYEIPMEPITMMRNALGAQEGGSGVSLDKQKYQKSIDFWQNKAIIKQQTQLQKIV